MVARTSAGLQTRKLQWLQSLRGDFVLTASLTIYVIAMLSYLFVLPDELRLAFDYDYGEILLLSVTVLLFMRAAMVAQDRNIRLFWLLMGGSFGIWLSVDLLAHAAGSSSSPGFALVKDLFYLGYFAATAIAVELRLDRRHRGPGVRQHAAAATGSILLILAVFCYFAILPLLASDRSYTTPFALHAALDLYFAFRFLVASWQAFSRSWQSLFAGFFAVFALIVVADSLSWLYRLEILDYRPGNEMNLAWFLWYPVAMLVSRIKLDYPTDDIRYKEDTKLTVATRGLLVFALALPFIHVLGYALGLFGDDARQLRDVFVAIWILLISALLFGVYFYFRKRVVELREQRTHAETKVEQIEDQLNRERRIQSLGRLSAGLAHDFGNSLTAISMYAGIIREKSISGEKATEDIDGLTESIGYARDLVDKLSLFGKSGEHIVRRKLNFNDEVRRAVGLLRASLPPNVELELRDSGRAIYVRAEKPTVHQVVTNYIYNAIDALRDGGQITVSVYRDDSRTHCASCGEALEAPYAVLNVSDTGPGVAESLLENVFEPLVTTKPVGKGSGLGLSTVHVILHSIGGHVGLTIGPGGGASFAAYFPIADDGV